jgi:hypothetical protein
LEGGRRRVGRGAQAGREEGEIAVAHLYRSITRPDTNVLTFALVRGYDRYKCDGLTFVLVGATNRYKCDAFILGGWEMMPTTPCERAPTDTNVVICTGP